MAEPVNPQTHDEDEVEPCMYRVGPSDNVYSFFMFISPTEERKWGDKAFTWDIISAYVLVAMNFFMQGFLLYLIYEAVVTSNIEWQNGVVSLGGHGIGIFQERDTSTCNDGGSLCFRDNGSYSCAPPSVQLTGRWKELDTNEDGIWTREEVVAAKEALQCKYVVNPVEVFDVLVQMLNLRKHLIWLHPDVESGKAIHFPYFTYAMGDLIMCSYRSHDMCSNLLERGFFHEALKTGKVPRIGKTIESALSYCKDLLKPGGTCESLLPSTYSVWKKSSGIECGSPGYTQFMYTNPSNGVKKSLLKVDYGAVGEYELAQYFWFKVFKGMILFLWLCVIFAEYKEIMKIMAVVMYLPDAEEFGRDYVIMEADPADPEDVRFRIQGIDKEHRTTMVFVTLVRIILDIALMVIGVSYIVKTNEYSSLLMNGVTLAFVAELSSLLYALILREQIRDQCEDIKPMKVKMPGIDWLNHRPALLDMISVVILMIIVYAVMEWQLANVVLPVHGALSCTCGQTGDNCLEAQKFNYDFWNHYWGTAVPGVFDQVDKMKSATPGAAMMIAHAPLLNTTMATHDLNLRAQELMATREKLSREIDTLQEQFQKRLGMKWQPPVAENASNTSATPKAAHGTPKAVLALPKDRDGEYAEGYDGSMTKFGSTLLQHKHRVKDERTVAL